MIIDPSKAKTKDFHQFLIGSVAPRPIAFVSTVDENGVPNIAPYSFFNAYSSNPPVLVFSSNRRVLNNTTKDTLHNIQTTKEVVVNMVNFDIVRQMALASVEFDSDISEFDKSGLTPIPAVKVKPSLIKESPVKLECKVKEIITLGEHGGAGHLIICDVVMMHIDDRVVDNGRINPHKIDLVGRLGRFHYVRAPKNRSSWSNPSAPAYAGDSPAPIEKKRNSQRTAWRIVATCSCRVIYSTGAGAKTSRLPFSSGPTTPDASMASIILAARLYPTLRCL